MMALIRGHSRGSRWVGRPSDANRSEQQDDCILLETCTQRPIIAVMFVSGGVLYGKYVFWPFTDVSVV